MVKGENLPVPGQAWRIEVARRTVGPGLPEEAVTARAMFLAATGEVVGQVPFTPGGVADGCATDCLDLDPGHVPAHVGRVVIVAVAQGRTFGRVQGLTLRTLSVTTGEPLAQYEIADADAETVLVLGEYERGDGGWRFLAGRAGFEAGLDALAKDFGISVSGPTASGPVELPHPAVGKSAAPVGAAPAELPRDAVGKTSGSGAHASARDPHGAGGEHDAAPVAPFPGQGVIPLVASQPPSPEVLAAAGILGGEFDDIVYSGRGRARFAMAATPPPGYVLVDFARTGTGSFDLDSIDWDGREAVDLGDSCTSRRFERRAMWCDNLYPLRFRVDCDSHDAWTIVIRPVSAARPLGEGATGRGSDVLLHAGPVGELVSHLRPAQSTASLRVEGHKPRRPDTPARYPDVLASEYGRNPKDARVLPEGPLLVAVVRGEGDWSLEVHPARTVPSREKRPGFWQRLRRG
ncbi:TerD family protein [Streptomyces sp. NPDC004288]